MGNQSSEMKAQYTGRPAMSLDPVYNAGIQPFLLSDHHNEGKSKVRFFFSMIPIVMYLR